MNRTDLLAMAIGGLELIVEIADLEFREYIFKLIAVSTEKIESQAIGEGEGVTYRKHRYVCPGYTVVIFFECGNGYSKMLCGYLKGTAATVGFYRV